jgi:hypothetical protein
MPQLEKGGKYVFGISVISREQKVIVPPEALQEYQFRDSDRVILTNGSRTSGGFVMTVKRNIGTSPLSDIFTGAPGLLDFSLAEGATVANRGRSLCWTILHRGGYIRLSSQALIAYHLKTGDQLVVVRGSNFGITLIIKGPIWELAMQHPEVKKFEAKSR